MVEKAAKLVGEQWKAVLFFVVIVVVLGSLSIYLFTGFFAKILLFAYGVFVYNAFFLFLGKALKGERIEKPFRFILIGKDNARYDFFVLMALFSAILLIAYGPFALFQAIFLKRLNDFIESIRPWSILFHIAFLIAFSAYKISLYAAVSSLTYHRNEVLQAFKDGIKGIWRFRGLLAALAIYEIGASFLLAMTRGAIINGVTLISYLIPAAIMLLMACSYGSPGVALSERPESEAMQPVLGQGVE